jgi:hypothetical protein
VESIEHVDRGGDLLGNHVEIGLPHVAAYTPRCRL